MGVSGWKYILAMAFKPAEKVFVDESKARGYFLVATSSDTSNLKVSEKALRSLLKPGQRRIHFKKERDSRRREILSLMSTLELRVTVFICQGLDERQARVLCLEALVGMAVESEIFSLVIERDETLVQSDKRIIAGILLSEGSTLDYQHVGPHEHPLLWVSDAVAWSFYCGGDWLRRCSPIVNEVIYLT